MVIYSSTLPPYPPTRRTALVAARDCRRIPAVNQASRWSRDEYDRYWQAEDAIKPDISKRVHISNDDQHGRGNGTGVDTSSGCQQALGKVTLFSTHGAFSPTAMTRNKHKAILTNHYWSSKAESAR
jgi:hypothetical protein